MNMTFIGSLLCEQHYQQSGYRGFSEDRLAECLQHAGPFLGYLLETQDNWEFMQDKSWHDTYDNYGWLKFKVQGSDRKNSTSRSKDEDAKKIYHLSQNPETDEPIFEVHYGRMLRWNFKRHQPIPTRMEWLEIFAYLTPFQELDNASKMRYLNENFPIEELVTDLEQRKIRENLKALLQRRIRGRLANIEEEMERTRSRLHHLYAEKKETLQQAENLTDIELELASIKRHHLVRNVMVHHDNIVVYTHQIPVIYYDRSLYERYRSNYYSPRQQQVLDEVMAGRLELCTSPYQITISLNQNRLEYNTSYEPGGCQHPHRSCQGDFSASIIEAQNEYDTYRLVSNLLQWYSSLAFDDSTVATNWLFASTGVRRPNQPETLVHLHSSEAYDLAALTSSEAPAEEDDLDLDFNLDLEEEME